MKIFRLSIVFLLFLFACSKSIQKTIIGKWQETGGIETIQFFNDGTINMTQGSKSFSGNYRLLDNNTLRIDIKIFSLKTITSKIEIKKGELIITEDTGKISRYKKTV